MDSHPEAHAPLPGHVAAVDLGSNSFHMLVARPTADGGFVVVDRLKEQVRLAGGLTLRGQLRPAVRESALACLRRMGERLRGTPDVMVRAVGTNTLRVLHDGGAFHSDAEAALGCPIEVVSGLEEARLIYRGAVLGRSAARRLVIDIGGGSTEIVLGEGPETLDLESIPMGSVGFSERFFPEGEITASGMRRAVLAARMELEGLEQRFGRQECGWTEALGSSGTAKAICRVLAEIGAGAPSPASLARLRSRVVAAGHVRRLDLPGLSVERRPVFPGGLAILSAVVGALGLVGLEYSDGALREGLLSELLGRLHFVDARDASVARAMVRFRVDAPQARRVEAQALRLFDAAASAWGLGEADRALLCWAARLHEAGTFLSFDGHHKHAAYLIAHADLPSFSKEGQGAVAAVVVGHRGSLSVEKLASWSPRPAPRLLRLSILLRIAARLQRSRADREMPGLRLSVVDRELHLSLPEEASDGLTRADMAEVGKALRGVGHRLVVETHSRGPLPAEEAVGDQDSASG
jgi:exopolyphosphatase/guanosine-5'-triphosphate,3'-diphosphate pyrophosphatase